MLSLTIFLFVNRLTQVVIISLFAHLIFNLTHGEKEA